MEAHAIYSDIKQGNLASFEWFYKKYHPRAYVFCKKILGDEDEAKDVTQESFILFWEYRNRIESPETLCSYLFQILKTQCLKQIRRNALQNNFSNLTDTKLKELELSYYTKERTCWKTFILRNSMKISRRLWSNCLSNAVWLYR